MSRAVRTYVRRRTEARTGLDPETFPRVPDTGTGRTRRQYPEKWNEEQTRAAREAFLQLRSRRSQAEFVEYFAGTLCAYGQPLGDSDLRALARDLLEGETWVDARALAMLAASTMVQPSRSADQPGEPISG